MGVQSKKSSLREVWIFSGTTQYIFSGAQMPSFHQIFGDDFLKLTLAKKNNNNNNNIRTFLPLHEDVLSSNLVSRTRAVSVCLLDELSWEPKV